MVLTRFTGGLQRAGAANRQGNGIFAERHNKRKSAHAAGIRRALRAYRASLLPQPAKVINTSCAKFQLASVAMTECTKRKSRGAELTAHFDVVRILQRRPRRSN
jgi:hypothetical protein